MRLALIVAAALTVTACATPFSLEDYAKAANNLDPDCGKRVHVQVTPMMIGPWVFPVIAGTYDKACNMGEFSPLPAAPPTPLLGSVVGG